MAVVKAIFIFFVCLYVISKFITGINGSYSNNKDRIMNLIEIIFGIALALFLFKI